MSLRVGRQVGSGYQLVGSGPEAYEAYLVPPLFEPCAEQLLAAVDVGLGESVVDVACGTGVVGRRAAELVGPAGAVVGVDVNPAMVAVAARVAPAVDWRVGGDAAVSMRAPFALGDREELRDLLVAAGFAEPILTLLASRRGSHRRRSCCARRWRRPTGRRRHRAARRAAGPVGRRARTPPGPPQRRPRRRGPDADLAGGRITGRRAIPPGRKPTAGCR